MKEGYFMLKKLLGLTLALSSLTTSSIVADTLSVKGRVVHALNQTFTDGWNYSVNKLNGSSLADISVTPPEKDQNPFVYSIKVIQEKTAPKLVLAVFSPKDLDKPLAETSYIPDATSSQLAESYRVNLILDDMKSQPLFATALAESKTTFAKAKLVQGLGVALMVVATAWTGWTWYASKTMDTGARSAARFYGTAIGVAVGGVGLAVFLHGRKIAHE
jgi:hypothetical protein